MSFITSVAGSTVPVPTSARVANVKLAASDTNTLVNITAGTFAQTMVAANTLAPGWWLYLKNSGTGDITLTPDAGLIDGLSSYVMYPGECRLIQSNGVTYSSTVIDPFFRVFTTTSTFVTPPGYQAFDGLVWSGGCSGANIAVTAQGGGGGGCAPFLLAASLFPASLTMTIGAGGAAVASGGGVGLVGGNSSIGALFTVYGSATYLNGGSVTQSAIPAVASPANGFEGARQSGSQLFNSSMYGGAAPSPSATYNSGGTFYGGGAGGSNIGGVIVNPGVSVMGGSGGAAADAASGTNGTAPGGGGGGSTLGAVSGAGARGEIRIKGVA